MKYGIKHVGWFIAAGVSLLLNSTFAQLDVDLDGLLAELPPPSANGTSTEASVDLDAAAPSEPSVADSTVGEPEADDPVDFTAEQERVLRQDREQIGLRRLDEAVAALRRGEYRRAFDLYSQARRLIPERPATDEALRQAHQGYAESAYRLALAAFNQDDFAEARKNMDLAMTDEARQGARVRALRRRIERREERIAQEEARPIPVEERPEIASRRESIEQFMENGRRYYEAGEWQRAERSFEQVLLANPYHREAMRFLQRIEERRLQRTNIRREATVAEMMRDVRDRWHPPIRQVVMAPDRPGLGEAMEARAARLQERMNQIVIPSIDFRQANIVDVIDFLREASIPADPEGIGVNIILQLDRGRAAPAADPMRTPAAMDDWGFEPGPARTPAAPPAMERVETGVPAITLSLRRVTLLDAIRYVTEVANLRYRIEDNAVIITPAGMVTGTVITRMYPVQPSILDVVVEQQEQDTSFGAAASGRSGEFIGMTGGAVDIRRGDVKTFFEQMGVPFPEGTNVSYNAAVSQLIVSNTAENLELFERILAQINVIPNQVEIETRFVEIEQSDLEELGFEWMMTDNYNLATRSGSDPIGMRQRIQVQENASFGGFTSGLRYFDVTQNPVTRLGAGLAAPMAGSLLSISSVLTNPELTFVMHALERRGTSDMLSAPKVATRSGVNAQIQVVREIIYPSEFMEQSTPGSTTSDDPIVPIQAEFRVPYPSAFETREVGVILNVTPTVGPDGYTIDLTLVPEVAELVDWVDYGPPDRFPILQPIFASRKVSTSVVVWDNQTVVMGGLIRDQTQSFDDKVPFLGDLPLVGRLFRSRGQKSQKRNLIIFVTARIIDPAGNPIHRDPQNVMVSAGASE